MRSKTACVTSSEESCRARIRRPTSTSSTYQSSLQVIAGLLPRLAIRGRLMFDGQQPRECSSTCGPRSLRSGGLSAERTGEQLLGAPDCLISLPMTVRQQYMQIAGERRHCTRPTVHEELAIATAP